MDPLITAALEHNWPLALAAAVVALYLAVALAGGVVYTNQGSVRRDADPVAYWRWVKRFVLLLVASLAVLGMAYYLGPH